MRVFNDFVCTRCEAVQERFEEMSISQVACHACGGDATKRIRPIRSVLDPISGSFPGATDKWVKHREARMKKEEKALDSHGSEYL